MMNFTTDQWVIVALVFVLGLLVGGFLFSGGGRKWRHKYNAEVERRKELERSHAEREKEWREQDSLRAAAVKNRPADSRDLNRDGVVTEREAEVARDDGLVHPDRDRDGIRDPDERL